MKGINMKTKGLHILLPLLCLTLLLGSCAAPALKVENGVYSHPKTEVSYVRAPLCYEAVAIVENQSVARLKQGGDDVVLYAIPDTDTAKMIASANYEIFYAQGDYLPELWEMDANRVQVTQTGTMTYAIATIENGADVQALVELYQNGVSFSADEIDVGLKPTRYDLKFSSPHYPAFYYTLTYWRFVSDVLVYEVIDDPNDFTPRYAGVAVTTEEDGGEHYAVYNFGKEILYNRESGECFAIGNTVSKYLTNSAE